MMKSIITTILDPLYKRIRKLMIDSFPLNY